MASVFLDSKGSLYHVYYSGSTGEIFEFEKKDHADNNWHPITEDYEKVLLDVSNKLIPLQQREDHGYAAFLFKLADEGKIELPE